VLGEQALSLLLVDRVLCAEKAAFAEAAALAARELKDDVVAVRSLLAAKAAERTTEWFQMLETHRAAELDRMRKCFVSDAYTTARQDFVLKVPPTATPPHLQEPWPVLTTKAARALKASWNGSVKAGEPAAAAAFEKASGGACLRAALDKALLSP